MEGDCGYAVWDNGYSPWTIGLQLLPYCLSSLLAGYMLCRARTYLSAGCRRTRYERNRTLSRITVQIAAWYVVVEL